MTEIASGAIHAFYLFDVAHAIDLASVQQILGPQATSASLQDKSAGPPRVRYFVPPVIADGGLLQIAEIDGFRVRVKAYDYGVISLMLSRAFAGSWPEFVRLGQDLIESESLEGRATEACAGVVERLRPALTGARATFLTEDYLAFVVHSHAPALSSEQMVEQHGGDIAQLLRGERQELSRQDTEAYPKAGTDNPIADILVYDVASKKRVTIDARDGKPFANDVVGHYIYNVRWSPNGQEVLLNRTNRRQQIMEFVACHPTTAKCRVIIREEWLTGWTNNRPGFRLLEDQNRFVWTSERNGWSNHYLYDLSGKLINPITTLTTAEAGQIVKLDEKAGVMFYMARDGDNYMKQQLHRVGLDGKGDVRLTDPKFAHSVSVSPDNTYFTDVYQTHDSPPATQLVDANGKIVAQLAKSDLTKFTTLGLKKVEMFSYKAADGVTTLYGTIAFPSTFDPSKKYPTLVPVYGGPASGSNVPTESFAQPSTMTEYGFLMVNLSSRAAPGMGKKTLDTIYMKLGQTEMDDMAEGIKALWNRPYFDKGRVGIYGTSYGGYTSAMEILRHPEVFTAASSSSPVTAWQHYDTIYTERYMWIPQENKEGYDAGSAMTYAKNLKGRLLLYYGTADNNVHPNNSMQLIRALQQAGKSFEVQVGPDAGHSGVDQQRMIEFFIENLIQRPERLMAPGGGGF